jgi:hypothetical protein
LLNLVRMYETHFFFLLAMMHKNEMCASWRANLVFFTPLRSEFHFFFLFFFRVTHGFAKKKVKIHLVDFHFFVFFFRVTRA